MTLALSDALGKSRLAYWANFANRDDGLEHVMGWVSNTHVVTVDVPKNGGTIADLCQQVWRAFIDARGHATMPLASLWQRLGSNLDSHDTRVNFDLWWGRYVAAPRPGPIEPILSSWLPLMDLDVRVHDDGQSFSLRSTYNSTRYQDAGVAAFVFLTAAIASRMAEYPGESRQPVSAPLAAMSRPN